MPPLCMRSSVRTHRRTGVWGPQDEVGSLNYLDNREVLRGVQEVRTGDVFTLQDPDRSPGEPG